MGHTNKQISDVEVFVQQIRKIMIHPITLGMFAYTIFVQAAMDTLQLPQAFPWVPRLVLYTCLKTAGWLIGYLFLGRLLWHTSRVKIPLFWVCMLVALFMESWQMFTIMLLPQVEPSVFHLVQDIANLMLIDCLAVALLVLYFQNFILSFSSSDPDSFAIWRPIKQIKEPLLLSLPDDMHGKILEIQSFNQYVAVTTDKGTSDIRMSLKEACENIDAEQGFRVHRSLWLHKDGVKELAYKNGNPHLKMDDGRYLPVGRNMVATLKEYLSSPS